RSRRIARGALDGCRRTRRRRALRDDDRAVAKRIGDDTVRMFGYGGSVPGPTLRAPEGGEIRVRVENRGDLEATVHWHGLRLDNRFDGTHETQKPMEVGEEFTYTVHCPDPGV